MSTKVNLAVKHMPRNIIPENLLIFGMQYFCDSWNVCSCSKTEKWYTRINVFRFGWKNNVNRIFCQLCIYFARNITNNIITWKYEDLLVQYSALWQAWLATWLWRHLNYLKASMERQQIPHCHSFHSKETTCENAGSFYK